MNIVLNETFEREGVAHGPFRVFVATDVVAKLFEADDEIFDVVYYFGKVSEDERLEDIIYQPDVHGCLDVEVNRMSLSLEEDFRVKTGEVFRELRMGEIEAKDYPEEGFTAVYFKRTPQGFWAVYMSNLEGPKAAEDAYEFSDHQHRDGVISSRTYFWQTREQLADQAQLFGLFGSAEGASEISIVDRPGLLGLHSEARA